MECYFCSKLENKIRAYTPCCIKPVCSLCAIDFKDTKCPCDNTKYREGFYLVKFSKKNNKTLGKLKYLFEQKIKEWNAWVDEAKTCLWKLPIPLDEYISAFNKSVNLYNENLESAKNLISAKKYVDGLNQFRYSADDRLPGRMIKNKKGEKTVTSYQFIDFFEKNIDKEWDWYQLSCNINITIDIVESHPNKPWRWDGLSSNANITFDTVLRYPKKALELVLCITESKYKYGYY